MEVFTDGTHVFYIPNTTLPYLYFHQRTTIGPNLYTSQMIPILTSFNTDAMNLLFFFLIVIVVP